MSLEAGDGFISGLVATNPVGAVDPKSQGDDHIRLIKVALKGTFPNIDAAVTVTEDVINGVQNASNLTSGTVADARLTSNVPLKDAANTFTGAVTFAKSTGRISIDDTSGTASSTVEFKDNGTAIAYVGMKNAVDAVIAGGAANELALRTSGALCFSGDAGATRHLEISSAGVLTTPNASAAEVGFKGLPPLAKTDNYTLVLSDAGKNILMNGASKTVTIPANASVPFPEGTVINIVAIQTLTIAITTDTLFLLGTGFATTGSRTLAAGGMATLIKTGSVGWCIGGIGLS